METIIKDTILSDNEDEDITATEPFSGDTEAIYDVAKSAFRRKGN